MGEGTGKREKVEEGRRRKGSLQELNQKEKSVVFVFKLKIRYASRLICFFFNYSRMVLI